MSASQSDFIVDVLLSIIKDAPEQIIKYAKKKANNEQKDFDKLKDGPKHRRLSQAWVKYLSYSLEVYYRKKNDKIFAFPGDHILKQKLGIKRKEFLFDISVGEYDHFKSKVHNKIIYYQSKPIWQIESEFAYNMVDMAIDFSKLLAGNASNKMMVGPLGRNKSKNYLLDMKQLAQKIQDNLYFLFIPRPNKWLDGRKNTKEKLSKWYLYKWHINDWKKVPYGEGNWIVKA